MATHIFHAKIVNARRRFEHFGVVGASLRQCFAQDKFTHLKLSTVRLWIQSRRQFSCSNSVTFEVGIIGLPGFRRDATTFGRASWNTQFGSDSSLACLVDKPCGTFVPWLFLPSKMAQRQRSVSTLPSCVETASPRSWPCSPTSPTVSCCPLVLACRRWERTQHGPCVY